MEQHRTRPPQRPRRPQTPLAPPGRHTPAGGVPVPATARRVPPVLALLRRLPNPRLTGLGAGLFAAAVMLGLGCLDQWLFDGEPLVYGVLFLLVSALTGLWVRAKDLVTAPISVPIAFALGAVPIADGTGSFGAQVMALVTTLAVHAGWLYGGTLVAGLIASVRKVRQMGRRQQARDAAAARTGATRTGALRTGATASRAVPAGAGRPAGARPPRPARPVRPARRG